MLSDEMTNRQVIGLLEAILIIQEEVSNQNDFKGAIRRIQESIEKGVTAQSCQDKQ